jgi:hypothetical protein
VDHERFGVLNRYQEPIHWNRFPTNLDEWNLQVGTVEVFAFKIKINDFFFEKN